MISAWMRKYKKWLDKVAETKRDYQTGGLVVKTQRFPCHGLAFNPWSGNWDPTNLTARPKEKYEKREAFILANSGEATSKQLCHNR